MSYTGNSEIVFPGDRDTFIRETLAAMRKHANILRLEKELDEAKTSLARHKGFCNYPMPGMDIKKIRDLLGQDAAKVAILESELFGAMTEAKSDAIVMKWIEDYKNRPDWVVKLSANK